MTRPFRWISLRPPVPREDQERVLDRAYDLHMASRWTGFTWDELSEAQQHRWYRKAWETIRREREIAKYSEDL